MPATRTSPDLNEAARPSISGFARTPHQNRTHASSQRLRRDSDRSVTTNIEAAPSAERATGSRAMLWLFVAMLAGVAVSGGCSIFKKDPDKAERERLEALVTAPPTPEFIRQAAAAHGLNPARIQSYGIVNNLLGTGTVEPPSIQRDQLLNQMKAKNVDDPNQFLDSDKTAIVLVETWIPGGARKGDPLDLIVRTSQRPNPNGEQASSLRNGWLMPQPLRFTQVIGGVPRTSDVLAESAGAVIIRGNYESGADPQLLLEGKILGGGVVVRENKLDLRIRPEYRHVETAKKLSRVINGRYYYFDGTDRRGIATPKQDDLIDVEVPERYRNNANRLMAVIGAMGTEEDITVTNNRIEELSRQLLEPTTAQDAALQLEGIGQPGVPALLAAMASPNPEIRFYAAEALAYLDNEEAIAPLVELSRDQPAFRYQTLMALSGMKQRMAGDGLRSLFDEPSLETRSGAFDAMSRRSDFRTFVEGRKLRDVASLYEVPSQGGPMVAVSLRRSPNIVIFGGPVAISTPDYLICGSGLTIVPDPTGGIQINRFVTGRPDQRQVVPPTVVGLCNGIVNVGGNYGDIIETLRLLAEQNALAAQLAIDVLPKPLREYHREPDFADAGELNPAALSPSPIDPPAAETEYSWIDPRGWF